MTNEERRREKLKNAVLYFVQHDKTVGLTKLMKLLYFLDFELYRDYGQSLSGQTYESWDFGPVPRDVWLELHEKKDSQLNLSSVVKIIPVRSDPRDEATGIKLAIKPGARFSDYYFSGRELKKLKEISDIFQGCTAKDIVKIAHKKDDPWDVTLHTKGEKQPIDYDLILSGCEEEHKEYIHEVRNDTAAFERILEHA